MSEMSRKMQIYRNRKKVSGCLELEVRTDFNCKWHEDLCGMINFSNIECGKGCTSQ